MEIKYIKSAARVLNRACINKGGLDLLENVLWVSVSQGVADLQAVKVGGLKKNWPFGPARATRVRDRPRGRIFFDLQL